MLTPARRQRPNLLGRPPEEPCYKVRYASLLHAERACERIAQERLEQGQTGKRESRAYACPRCAWAHLTARPLRGSSQPDASSLRVASSA